MSSWINPHLIAVEKNKLGVLINLGITHVTDDSGLLSTTVDKYLKKFNKKVRITMICLIIYLSYMRNLQVLYVQTCKFNNK